jgi:uncharacterized protein YeaO (DUF488 family)
MAIRIVRLGSARAAREGLRLGTVRRPPRGVRKEDYAPRNYYDLWLPDLAPSAKLVAQAQKNWPGFAKAYRREMNAPAARRLLELLAQLSQQAEFSVGCYCEDEERCHRSILRELLAEHGARLA